MVQFHLYFDKDEETEWLNRMAATGWAMKRFFAGFYSFEKCEKGEYVYQVDFGDRMYAVSDGYREFMQESGIEIVQTWGYWVILRKKASEGAFELYTDAASSLQHYKKIRRMFKVAAIVEMLCLFMELYGWAVHNISIAFFFMFVIGAILIGCLNMVIKLNEKIGMLQEQVDGIAYDVKHKRISTLLPAGLLLNSCAFLIGESVPLYFKYFIQIAAIVLMAVGLFMTYRKK